MLCNTHVYDTDSSEWSTIDKYVNVVYGKEACSINVHAYGMVEMLTARLY